MNDVAKEAKLLKCTVTSDKMNKSRVAQIVHMVKHKGVGKYIKRTTKIMFHDEKNQTKSGDEVLVSNVKPISSRKSFSLHSVIKSSNT